MAVGTLLLRLISQKHDGEKWEIEETRWISLEYTKTNLTEPMTTDQWKDCARTKEIDQVFLIILKPINETIP